MWHAMYVVNFIYFVNIYNTVYTFGMYDIFVMFTIFWNRFFKFFFSLFWNYILWNLNDETHYCKVILKVLHFVKVKFILSRLYCFFYNWFFKLFFIIMVCVFCLEQGSKVNILFCMETIMVWCLNPGIMQHHILL